MNETTTVGTGKAHPQKLVMYHPNSAGTGAALQLEPRLNRQASDRYNFFFLELAAQKGVADRAGGKAGNASFDWEHKLTVKLDFTDLCEILAVLEGRAERLGGQKNGLFHRNGESSTVITLQKGDRGGYFLGLSKKSGEGPVLRVSILLSDAEMIGLRCVLQGGLFFLSFHDYLFPPAA